VPGLIESLKKLILSDDFCKRHKKTPNAFTRDRLLPFHRLIYLLLNMNNNSYQDELDRFYKIIFRHDMAKRILYKGNLTKAREKLDYEAFTELNDLMINLFYKNFNHQTWHGFNLLAIDGSTLRVPNEKATSKHFGAWTTNNGTSECPIARASQMFDVLNKVTVDAILRPKSEGERELATFHLLKLQAHDLLLLDRGYPAHWFFKAVLSVDAQFCARISYKKWRVVKKFYKSGKSQAIVRIYPSEVSKQKCRERGFDITPVTARLIRVELDSGETEILVTSLTDQKIYPKALFKDLYHSRWPVEEDYKTLKYRLQVENFSGKTVHSVYQDFHAKVFSKNLTAVIATTTLEEIKKKSDNLKYIHQLNFAQALAKMKDTIVMLFNSRRKKLITYVEQIREIFIQTTEAIRPNRKYPRRHRVKQARFYLEYKTTC
jgi:DDE family transposase